MKSVLAVVLLLVVPNCFALDIEVKMLAQGSAVLQIDGKQRMLRQGVRSPEGVLLVSAGSRRDASRPAKSYV